MSRYSFSKPANFAIHVPMFVLNLFIVGGLVWDMTPSTQVKIFANHTTHVSPVVSLVANSIATIYGLTLLLLAVFNIIIPALPRIIIDSIILWPCHLLSIIILGLWNDWSALKQLAAGQVTVASGPNPTPNPSSPSAPFPDPSSHALSSQGVLDSSAVHRRELTCTDASWTSEMCTHQWKTVTIIQTLAFAFGWLCLLLVVVDFVISVRIYKRRRYAREAGINPDEDDSDSESIQGLTTNRTQEVGGRWVTITGRS